MIPIRVFLSPHFVIKYYVYRDIQQLVKTYIFKGSILDVGCGSKPYKKFFTHSREYKGIDFKNYSQNKEFDMESPDYYFNQKYIASSRLPFKDTSYSHCVSFQVLEHHKNPQKLIREMIRVVKPGGYIMLSFPFIGALHELPHDYFRITEFTVASICKEEKVILKDLRKQGSVCSVISIVLTDALIEIAHSNAFFYVVCIVISPFFYILGLVSVFMDIFIKTNSIFLNYVVIIKK